MSKEAWKRTYARKGAEDLWDARDALECAYADAGGCKCGRGLAMRSQIRVAVRTIQQVEGDLYGRDKHIRQQQQAAERLVRQSREVLFEDGPDGPEPLQFRQRAEAA